MRVQMVSFFHQRQNEGKGKIQAHSLQWEGTDYPVGILQEEQKVKLKEKLHREGTPCINLYPNAGI